MGDLCQWIVGQRKQLLDVLQLRAEDLRFRRTAQQPIEAAFQRTTGRLHVVEYVANADAVTGVCSNEVQSGRDVSITDCHEIRG